MAVKEKRSQENVQMRKKHEKTHPGDEQDEKDWSTTFAESGERSKNSN